MRLCMRVSGLVPLFLVSRVPQKTQITIYIPLYFRTSGYIGLIGRVYVYK